MHYLESHFALSDDGGALAPEPIGAQFDGDFLWLCQDLLRRLQARMQDFSAA